MSSFLRGKKNWPSFTCHAGADKTRDELRRQVYDAMAEKEKDGQAEPVSEDATGNSEVKKENGAAQSPVKHVNGSAQEDKENGVVESQTAGKESETEEVEQNGHKPEGGEDSKEEADQDGEGAEGSMFVTVHVVWSSKF